MFTVEQIKSAHAKVKTGADFPRYVQDILKLGVRRYESFVADGHILYFGIHDYRIQAPAKYDRLHVAEKSNTNQFRKELKEHQQGKTDYLSFCRICAEQGVYKWIVDLSEMTCTYYDNAGNEMLVEKIPKD
jgi:uncharacterized protein YbcV (DUF1398 family)